MKASRAGTLSARDIALRQPEIPRIGRNRFLVTVRDGAGDPVRDAEVSLTFYYRGIPGPKGYFEFPRQTRVRLVPGELAGTYEGVGSLNAAGAWEATMRVVRRGDQLGATATKVWVRR